MADWVPPSVFGTKFVCKLMAASRSYLDEVETTRRRRTTLRSDATCAMRTQPRQSRHNVSINEQKIYHE